MECLILLMNHFGGFNTFLARLLFGVGVCPTQELLNWLKIQEAEADLLPTTPTFLAIIASRLYATFDFSSIELITWH